MTGARLIRRGPDGTTTWQQREATKLAEDEAPRPTSRRISFELPDGYMATISLVPYTELPSEPDPPADAPADEAAN